jgi:DNA modification methylase
VGSFAAILEAAEFSVRSRAVWVKNNHGQGDVGTLAPMHELILHATLGGAGLYDRVGDVFTFDKVPPGRHPTEKPQDLFELLIRISTAKGDLVADPFGGVATTAAAARATGRGYWSCELVEKHWADGQKRLDGG